SSPPHPGAVRSLRVSSLLWKVRSQMANCRNTLPDRDCRLLIRLAMAPSNLGALPGLAAPVHVARVEGSMGYAVAQLGARMHYAVPRILHARGQLTQLFTDIAANKGWLGLCR